MNNQACNESKVQLLKAFNIPNTFHIDLEM